MSSRSATHGASNLQVTVPSFSPSSILLTQVCGTQELAPTIPFRHGHAISVDMAYSTTLAWTRGYITEAERDEILGLFVRVGLTVDHELFDEACLEKGTQAIMSVHTS